MKCPTVPGTVAIACLILASITQAHAQNQTADLVSTTETFNWDVPSTDPTGVVYVPGANSLFVSDSEVNETVLFTGSNLFQTGLDGSVYELFSTLDFTDEPTGITVNPANGHMFISTDNSPRRIYEINPGPDGIYRNADDTITWFSTSAFNCSDAEGITYNPVDGRLYIADGLPNLVHIVDPGPNLLFDGIAPAGDDTVTSFDTSSLGVIDPEGIAYDSLTDALYVIGEPVDQLLHVSTSGDFLRMITLDSPLLKKPAGLGIGPSSLANGADSLYLVDRGDDNDYDPAENDGRMFEFTLPPVPGNYEPSVTIMAPLASQAFEANASVTFTGSAIDPEDGDLSAALVWESDLDGLIGNGAQFSTSSLTTGLHSITASAVDSDQALGLSLLTLRIYAEGTVVVESRINSSSDDAEQRGLGGNTWLTGNDLELIDDNSIEQIVGLRFNSLQIPTYATIEEAYIRFQADESQSAAVTLEIRAQASDNAEPVQGLKNNLTDRLTTNASSTWQPLSWSTVGESAQAQKTSDLTALVQEVVNRQGWNTGNSMAFLISGSGPERRTAESFDSVPEGAPLLYVRYTEAPSAPLLIISSPSNGENFATGVPVLFSATAEDIQDGNLNTSINWDSDQDGPLGSDATVTVSNLSLGTHLITASVTDGGGLSSSEAISITIEPPVNTAPSLSITTPADGSVVDTDTLIILTASAMDTEDGDLSGSVTWASDLDGELGVGTASAYLNEGLHTITASVSDSDELEVAASITVQVDSVSTTDVTLGVRVSAGSDDAEERYGTGRMALTSSDLELVMDGSKTQVVGMRFSDLQIPQNAGIVAASIQFQVEEMSSDLTFLNIAIQESDDSATFGHGRFDITARPRSARAIRWLPSPWENLGSAGTEQTTPDLSELVQHIVTRDNWTPGNSMVFLIDGDGTRTAVAYESQPDAAPQLTITYTLDNVAPTVETSADLALFVSDSAFISATVDDDGMPSDPGSLSYEWSLADGPGLVTFTDATNLSTAASFDSVGTYSLMLSASDGQLSAYDVVTVTVQPSPLNMPPTVSAGSDQQGTVGETLNLNGAVADDGLPGTINAQDAINWTQLSGPASALIENVDSASINVDFSEIGTYEFDISAFDGELLASDQVVVTVIDSQGNGRATVQITDSEDDAEESAFGSVDLVSTDIELVEEKSSQIVGLRFRTLPVPGGAVIKRAHIQFTADEVDAETTDLNIQAENADDSALFTTLDGSLASRPTTLSSVNWSPAPWSTPGEISETQNTPDLKSVIQEIVDRPGWVGGNALSIIIAGSGTRTAESYDGNPESAARLVIEFQALP